ncbi:MAG: dockerin type I domain-containing protein [Phycisphaerales bacterium]
MKICFGTSLIAAGVLAASGATTALGQVAGDECTNAITALEGPNSGYTTATATASANPPADETCTFLDWGASKDLWFVYNATTAGLMDLDFCASGYDTSIVIYTGSCAALTRIACDDDSCPGGTDFQSYKTGIAVTAPGPVFIRVGGWNAASGDVSFNLTFAPASAGCEGATGGCGTAHGAPGCNDPVCCTSVCNANPLCCDIGWDANCVQTAVAVCGIFVYSCNQGTPANDCATNATVVNASGAYPFSTVGANTDGPDHPGATCNSGSNLFAEDVWWRVQAPANGILQLSTCGACTYDNKLAVYNMGSNPAAFDYNTLNTALVGCNDDGASGACYITGSTTPYASALNVSVNQGTWYLIRNGSYAAGDEGSGTLTITLPEICQLPSASGSESEACGSDTNGGCNATTGTPTTPITLGQKLSGTFWADANNRDTDWYSISLASATNVNVNLWANVLSTAFIVTGDCSAVVSQTSFGCPSTNATICLPAGDYFIAVVTDAFTGTPCGSGVANNYVVEVTGTPATCPPSTDVCDDAGPNTTTQSNDPTLTIGGVACGAGGITTPNTYARSFPGLSSGEIRCVEVGYSNSGSPVAVSVILCRDTDGGAPGSIGTDLVELARRDFVPFTGFGFVTAKFDEPVCVDGNTNPLVVVMDIADSNDGFATYAGNEAGATAPTYILSTACGINTFTDVASIGFGNLQWVVNINGDYSGCGSNCPTDLNGDGVTNAADLAVLLGGWNSAGATDLNGDGTTNAADLAVLLGGWGNCP